jgi:hypothetical protein
VNCIFGIGKNLDSFRMVLGKKKGLLITLVSPILYLSVALINPHGISVGMTIMSCLSCTPGAITVGISCGLLYIRLAMFMTMMYFDHHEIAVVDLSQVVSETYCPKTGQYLAEL